ncbi:bacteriohemerythrin [Neiella marina]|uniref:diguanylate cyclase n=1 Tax=Neiella holothuriorum TaxID=2870530 RepID=A0ABS7EKH5_9GAMM|nr:GGDEF domain-containing protein [Neiella holothuriorum]MBW8192849.1 bacteriohemerythrin [Neiella holothuriorum]
MQSFQWSSNFVTGIDSVDSQHQQLVALVNQLGDLLSEGESSEAELMPLLAQLKNYTAYHFCDEEGVMAKWQIDDRHLTQHVLAHQQFLHEVDALQQELSLNGAANARYLMEFLVRWLAYHILGQDQNMAQQIELIQQGLSPQQAFDAEERSKDRATAPLLSAMNALFEQVSQRNRELVQLNQTLEQKVQERTEALYQANQHLEQLSLTDMLTSLPNRRRAMQALNQMWLDALAHQQHVACMMIDADHFKQVNDTYGHDAGDQVLVSLANTLASSVRNDDLVCRLGGDEFLVLCPNTDTEGLHKVAGKVHQAVCKLQVATDGEPWQGSISVGIAAIAPVDADYKVLLKLADEGVYAAKAAGKNCIRATSQAEAIN